MIGSWQLFIIVFTLFLIPHVVLAIISCVFLYRVKATGFQKIMWLLAILFIVLLGSIFFHIWRGKQIRQSV